MRLIIVFVVVSVILFGCSSQTDVASSSRRGFFVNNTDLKWKPFYGYEKKLVSAIYESWAAMLDHSREHPKRNTIVTVIVRVEATKGAIAEIVSVDGDSDELGKKFCVAAIGNAAPFGAWTSEMVDSFGGSQSMTFEFHYE
jgi:hypothetical protein